MNVAENLTNAPFARKGCWSRFGCHGNALASLERMLITDAVHTDRKRPYNYRPKLR
jgi:hypothetical protein